MKKRGVQVGGHLEVLVLHVVTARLLFKSRVGRATKSEPKNLQAISRQKIGGGGSPTVKGSPIAAADHEDDGVVELELCHVDLATLKERAGTHGDEVGGWLRRTPVPQKHRGTKKNQ